MDGVGQAFGVYCRVILVTIILIIPTDIVDSLMCGCFQGPKRGAPGLSRNEECRNKKSKKLM